MSQIIIASIMRPNGETGVQTHFNSFRSFLIRQQIKHQLITPFSYTKLLVYPVFAIRKILDKLSGELSVWWYRYWHAYFLKLALKQSLHQSDDCVIYAQCPLSAAAALSARKSAKQCVVMVIHFNVSQADEWVGKGLISSSSQLYHLIRNFEAEVLPKLDGLVFVSEFMHCELLQRIPAISKVPTAIVPNFLSDPGESVSQSSKADLISIGTLEPRKNQLYLLEIIAALRKLGTDLTLTIVGDGPDRAKLEQNTNKLHIQDLVSFAGFIKHGAEEISKHKAYIHVANIENLPITLIEAMARSRPIFAAPVGGIPEVIEEGTTGLLLPLDDANAAAILINSVINDEKWLYTTGIAARSRFLTEYTDVVCATRLCNFLLSTRPVSEISR